MDNLFEDLFADFFKTSEYIQIIKKFDNTLAEGFNKTSKEYYQNFRKFEDYRKFRRRLWKRVVLSLIFLIPLIFVFVLHIKDTLISNKINSGSQLTFILMFLFFLFLTCSIFVAPFFLNSHIASSNLNEKTLVLSNLLLAYVFFLISYFFTYENTTINYMFNLSSENHYKVKAILEMTRSFLVFTLTAIVFSNFNAHVKSLSTGKNESENNKKKK